MALFGKQLLKVIQWEDTTTNTIVHKFEQNDRYAIMKGSELIVRPSQAAIFVYRGSIGDVFTEGNWKLEEGSTPILTKLANWKYAFENPKELDVYFVNLKRFTQMKWGTPNPIMMRDKDFGVIRLSGHGEYSFHVMKPDLFMRECFGTIHSFKTEDIQEHLKSIVLSELIDLLGECSIPALELAANYKELGDTARNNAAEKFREIGLDVDQIIIRNLKLPEAVEKVLDQRTSVGVFDGKMSDYAQFESVQAMRDAAKNPSGMGGMMAGAGIGFGVGARVGSTFADGLGGASAPKATCPNCKKEVKADAKFCPHCGSKLGAAAVATAVCSKCGKDMPAGSKFCPNCGQAVNTTCSKCGTVVSSGSKFCPNCGEKLK